MNCPQPGIYNYFFGNDPKRWAKDVHGYSQVVYHDLWKGIDLKLYANGSNVEQEFQVHPNADVGEIRMAYQGIKGLEVAQDGSLVVHTAFGDLHELKPKVYQEIAGKSVSVDGQFALTSGTSYRFEVKNRSTKYALVIDPTLLYSTYLGGSGSDQANGIAVDSAGDAYVTGQTQSQNFPTTSGAFETTCTTFGGSPGTCSTSAFITKLNPLGGARIYSTYLATKSTGQPQSVATGIAIDSAGEAYVTGWTLSSYGFPTTSNAFQTNCGTSTFFAKLNTAGDGLVYSTCLGNVFNGYSPYAAIAVDSTGRAYLTGSAYPGFPTTPNVFQSTAPGGTIGSNAFIAIINPQASGSASLVYSTYLGGSNKYGSDAGRAIAVDASGMVYVAGQTGSTDFPTTAGAFQTQPSGFPTCPGSVQSYTGPTAFVAKLNPSASGSASLVYSTFLGGSLGASASGIAVDSMGSAYVTGTASPCGAQACSVSGCTPNPVPFPTTPGAYQADNGYHNAFVTKLNAAGSRPVYSTIVASATSSAQASASGIALDSSGDAYIVGTVGKGNFPVTPNAFQNVCRANDNAFLTELNSSGSGLVYSTYIGGTGVGGGGDVGDSGESIAVDAVGDAYITGSTTSSNFPVTGRAYRLTLQNPPGWSDAFVTKFPLGAPQGLSILGITPSAGGNAGSVTPQIVGSGFHPGATVELTGSGGQVLGTAVNVSGGGRIMTATFDLTSAEPGPVDLVVTNPKGASATLPDALTIQQGGAPNIHVTKVGSFGRLAILPPFTNTYIITFSNSGNVDVTNGTLTEYLEKAFLLASASPPPVTSLATLAADSFVSWNVPRVPAGGALTFTYSATLDPSTPGGSTVVAGLACGNTDFGSLAQCLKKPAGECAIATLVCLACTEACPGSFGIGCVGCIAACVKELHECANADREGQVCLQQKSQSCDSVTQTVDNSPQDPNYLSGPSGVGGQGWISHSGPLSYVIDFGNESSAGLPAQQVVVTLPLNPNLNASTLTLLGMTIPNGTGGETAQVAVPTAAFFPVAGVDEFTTNLDLRPTQNLLVRVDAKLNPAAGAMTWTFTSIDPTTGRPPSDATVGFLAPGAEASLFFTVTPKTGLATRTAISSQASVVFSNSGMSNPPVSTNIWLNTLDDTPPVSSVAVLPAQESSSCFKVQWSGTDVGSGVQSYTIFVSDNGEAYTAWQTNTTATSAIYSGQPGHTYAFYSQAQDLVGNMEAAKTSPDTTTTVTSGATCGAGTPGIAGTITSKVLSAAGLTVTVQLTNDGQGNAQNVTINEINLRTLSGTGTVMLANPLGPVPLGNLAVGASTSVTLKLNVPSTVKQFSIAELGSLQNASGTSYNFGIAQVVYPSR